MAVSRSNCSRTADDLRDQLRQQGINIVFEDHDWEETSATADDELEKAMASGTRIIIIEPLELGEMTSVWIGFGRFLNRLSLYTGLGTLATAYFWPKNPHFYCSLGAINFVCTAMYGVAWQFDPCSKYRVVKSPSERANLPLHLISTYCPVVLARKNTLPMNCTRIILTFSAVGYCLWNVYKLWRGEIIPGCELY
ncbi:transmembrane protein 11-B, mitochondrial-like [Centruroides sculpturatus]|uniref:transmembrane protein 11-B, mitochondrial-like n=1 Tax=Centruroides sculpturatus TaxID=218467 RepID=UPI000C6CFF54|nr:transmembrane protein 11-B, mitochondrial-like [Centruroides sculpturatus]